MGKPVNFSSKTNSVKTCNKNPKRSYDLKTLLQGFLFDHQCNGNSKKTISYYNEDIGKFITYLEKHGFSQDTSSITLEHVKQYTMFLKSSFK